MQYGVYRKDLLWSVQALLEEDFKSTIPVTTRGRIREVQEHNNQYRFTIYSLFAKAQSYIDLRGPPPEIDLPNLRERLIFAALGETKLRMQGLIHNKEFKVEAIQFPDKEIQLVPPEQMERLSRELRNSLDACLISQSIRVTIFD